MSADAEGPSPEEEFTDRPVEPSPAEGEQSDPTLEVPVTELSPPTTDELAQTAPLLSLSEDAPALATLVATTESLVHPRYEFAFRCHIGAVRSRNEDSCFVFQAESGGQEPMPPFGLYIVADGMGGHFNGHEASRKVSRMVGRQVLEKTYLSMLRTENPGTDREPVQDVMLQAVEAANMAIYSPNPDEDTGTTLTAVLLVGRRLYLAHVGDSRAYMLKNGDMEQLTKDHTLVQRLQDAGQLTPEEAEQHHYRNVLYRAVGQGDDLEVDISTRALPREGKLFLCSDGLWGLVPLTVIQEVLQQEDVPMSEMLDTLVGLALQAGGHDNITGVIVSFTPQ
jgi:protein phosphatase